MDKPTIIETLGLLTKEETLRTLHGNILPNTLVLESLEPFPGYHGASLPIETKTAAIYMVTASRYTTEKITRAIIKTSRLLHFDVDGAPTEIRVNNTMYYGIRILNVKAFDRIPELQQWLIDEEIVFMRKKNLEAVCLTSIRKGFRVERTPEGYYKDLTDENMYYVEINRGLSWSMFRKVTVAVKNNIDNRNFDAALAYFYLNGITDVVRIYAKSLTNDRIADIDKHYAAEIARLMV